MSNVEPTPIGHEASAVTTLDDQYEDIGSAVGVVELVGSNPRPYFILREHTTGRAVPVYFTDVHQEQILASYRRRIEVIGRIRHEGDGTPVAIEDVIEIEHLPRADELPPPESFLGALPELMGDLTFEEYMDHIRGRDVEQ